MKDSKRSRAYDPTYKPAKTWADVAKEFPNDAGAKMMADREKWLLSQNPPSSTKGTLASDKRCRPVLHYGPTPKHNATSEVTNMPASYDTRARARATP